MQTRPWSHEGLLFERSQPGRAPAGRLDNGTGIPAERLPAPLCAVVIAGTSAVLWAIIIGVVHAVF
jgi:hypothetical protein